jgi:poly(glycerol-phosphate) alpha-glucosyltransferase
LILSQTKRVTHLTNSISRVNGGVFDAMRNLVIAIKADGRYAPTVMGLKDAETERDRPLWGHVQTASFVVKGTPAFGYAPQLAEGLERSNADILHIHGLWMYPSVAAIRWSNKRKPYIVSPHGMLDPWALRNSQWKKRISAIVYEARHLRGAACLHALNLAEAKAIRDFGLKNPICVIPNGVDLPECTEPRPRGQTHTLFYLGRLHPKKGLRRLLEAWSLMRKEAEHSGWRLAIAGWDQAGHLAELQELAARLHLESSVSFEGPYFGNAKADRFNAVSAFILPSLSEGLPMTILEAWSWGLPVLMTPECNLPEGADAGAAIMMTPEVESIANAMRQLFSMSDIERERMGSNGITLVAERFRWPRIAEQMADVYDWALGVGPGPSCLLN